MTAHAANTKHRRSVMVAAQRALLRHHHTEWPPAKGKGSTQIVAHSDRVNNLTAVALCSAQA